jgi:hypothetical protein
LAVKILDVRRRALLVLLVLSGTIAFADDKNAKAPTPGHGVIMLKAAWESGDLDAVVRRYAEPGASYIRSDLAAQRKVEQARDDLGKAVREKLGAGAEKALLEPWPRRLTSPLVDASVVLCPNGERIKGDHATTHFRVSPAPKDGDRTGGDRYFRFVHVRASDGDWKIVLSTTDGVPLDAKALEHVAAGSRAHEKAALALLETARDVRAGNLSGKEPIRKKIEQIFAEERRVIEGEQQVERRDEGHEND